MSRSGQAQTWNPDTYARNARFVAELGQPVVDLPLDERAAATAEVCELLRPALCDSRGRWTADDVRLRFAARRRE